MDVKAEAKGRSIAVAPPSSKFQMPLHYPRYTRKEYEVMSESELDLLFSQYGLPPVNGDVNQKRQYAKGLFLWPCQWN